MIPQVKPGPTMPTTLHTKLRAGSVARKRRSGQQRAVKRGSVAEDCFCKLCLVWRLTTRQNGTVRTQIPKQGKYRICGAQQRGDCVFACIIVSREFEALDDTENGYGCQRKLLRFQKPALPQVQPIISYNLCLAPVQSKSLA